MRPGIAVCLTLAVLLRGGAGAAHTITIDGDPSDWVLDAPPSEDLGHIARDVMLRGEYVWRDRAGDERTNFADPDLLVDITEVRVTADRDQLFFLVRMNDIDVERGDGAPQVQIAIDSVPGSGVGDFLRDAFTRVASAGAWEHLVVTRFGSDGAPFVFDTRIENVGGGRAAAVISAEHDAIEIAVPWTVLFEAPPSVPLRFSVVALRSNALDYAWWTSDVAVPNVIDAVTNYGDPGSVFNTWIDLEDGRLDALFEVWFHLDPDHEPSPPLVVNEVLFDARLGVDEPEGEWVEIYNRTGIRGFPLGPPPGGDASQAFKVGDEETVNGGEGTFAFPADAITNERDVALVVNDVAVYTATYAGHAAPDFEVSGGSLTPDMVRDRRWSTASSLNLSNTNDDVLLIDPYDTIIDVVSWGSSSYPGITHHRVVSADHSLERLQIREDTDDCGVDLTDHGPDAITPGAVWILGDLGDGCGAGADCASGICVDDVCCDRACDGACDGSCATGHCELRSSDFVCRDAAGACDRAEQCTGVSSDCPADGFLPDTEICRPSAGVCDEPERCPGDAVECPDDAFLPGTEVCRSGAGVCDAPERCPGDDVECPDDDLLPESEVCRPAADLCDAVETCTGSSVECPEDLLLPDTATCRPAADECDAAETCDGESPSCPDDDPSVLDGESCDDALDWTVGDMCEAGDCLGYEVGSCEFSVVVDSVPFTHDSSLVGRVSHISAYDAGCDGLGVNDHADVIYALDASPGESFLVTLDVAVDLDGALAVIRRCHDGLSCLAAADDGGEGVAEELGFAANGSGTFFIVVEGVLTEGDYTLRIIEGTGGDGDADADGDGDGDGDADGDADSDGDGGGDADGDVDGDADADDGPWDPNDGTAPGGCTCAIAGGPPTGLARLVRLLASLLVK